jgi:hypothetical protein
MGSGITGDATRTNVSKCNRERGREVVTILACSLIPAAIAPTTGAKAGRYIASNDERVMKSNKLGIKN